MKHIITLIALCFFCINAKAEEPYIGIDRVLTSTYEKSNVQINNAGFQVNTETTASGLTFGSKLQENFVLEFRYLRFQNDSSPALSSNNEPQSTSSSLKFDQVISISPKFQKHLTNTTYGSIGYNLGPSLNYINISAAGDLTSMQGSEFKLGINSSILLNITSQLTVAGNLDAFIFQANERLSSLSVSLRFHY